nr:hypothetical protein [Tanacetum cinerariifolium]
SVPTSLVHDRYKSGEGYHVVPPPYIGTFMPLKPHLVFHDAPTASETVPKVLNVEPSTTKPNKDMSQTNRLFAPIIDDWVSDSEDAYEGERMPTQKASSFAQNSKLVKPPRTFVKLAEHPTQAKNLRKDNHKSRFISIAGIERLVLFVKVNHQNYARMTHPRSKKDVVPTAVLTRSRLVPLNAARPVTTVVPQTNVNHQRPPKHVVNMPHSSIRRPINRTPASKNSNFHQKVTTVKPKKGKQHRASCKTKPVCSVNQPLQRLHMDLFGPTVVKSLNKKSYCLVVTDDYSRVLVTKPHNKTPYELLLGRTPSIGFMRPFRCPVTILNTLHPLRKFDRKADEGFLVGYSVSSMAFRVFNSRTRIVQETLHINFLENQPNVAGNGLTWLFDIDTLTQSMNYQPVVAGNQPNHTVSIQGNFYARKVVKEVESAQQYMLLPLWSTGSKDPQNTDADAAFIDKENESEVQVSPRVRYISDEFEEFSVNSTNGVNAASTPVTVVRPNSPNSTNSFNAIDDEEDVGAEADFSNLETTPQTTSKARMVKEQGGLTQINDEDFHT